MTIELFGYKVDLEIIILIGIIYLIMVVHTLFSVVNVEGMGEFIQEGFQAVKEELKVK